MNTPPPESLNHIIHGRGNLRHAMIAPNQVLKGGTVLGRVTDPDAVTGPSFKDPTRPAYFKAFDPSASDGSEIAAGVAGYAIRTGEKPAEAKILTHGARVVGFLWPASATPDQIAAAIEQLRQHGLTAELPTGSPQSS